VGPKTAWVIEITNNLYWSGSSKSQTICIIEENRLLKTRENITGQLQKILEDFISCRLSTLTMSTKVARRLLMGPRHDGVPTLTTVEKKILGEVCIYFLGIRS
jgi:hypothetical protein